MDYSVNVSLNLKIFSAGSYVLYSDHFLLLLHFILDVSFYIFFIPLMVSKNNTKFEFKKIIKLDIKLSEHPSEMLSITYFQHDLHV